MPSIKKSSNNSKGPFHVLITTSEETYRQGPYTRDIAQRVAAFVVSKGDSAVILDKNKNQINHQG